MSNSESVEAGEAATHSSRAQQMLLDFLREHEADPPACPVCGYNLKALVRPICPECGHDLVLTVGVLRPRLGWLLIALAPGFFSGIAAILLLLPIVARLVVGDGKMSPALNALDLFGWCSGIFAVVLAIERNRFLALTRSQQRWFAIGIWIVHVAALVAFVLIGPAYL